MAQAAAVAKPPAPPRRRGASATPRRLPYLLIAPAALLNTGAIVVNRTTAYANSKWGYYFATGAAKLGKNLAVSNGGGSVGKGSSVTSAGNNWDSGISTPAFKSTDASSCYNAHTSDGSLPATAFLTTGSTTIGATMN